MGANTLPDNIVFYDGECGFCNSTVQFILKKRNKDFYFLPLQSAKAIELLQGYNIKINLDTVYYLKNHQIYDRSSAALHITLGLKGLHKLLFPFILIPKKIRDFVYNIIAKNRHRIRTKSCVLPLPEEQEFFL
ncbi:thiol-disulfide oxidoreductase DCC family protein [Crocinitomix algicola]|uniref:thiol-disulfide oxidoreductase DCC family protein n=1 Tax=Crocinitomix algicola TaxID=1740263 RepID=UPI000872D024|nr:DUF393 domain-containing protein [Crocinitomix algicola]